MTRPVRTSKLLLIAERRADEPGAATGVRRFRLARLRFEGQPAGPAVRRQVAEPR